jgi:hypothetical protein
MDTIYQCGKNHYNLFNLWKKTNADDLTEEEARYLCKMVKVLRADMDKLTKKLDDFLEAKHKKNKFSHRT